jgi:hypothetical protein
MKESEVDARASRLYKKLRGENPPTKEIWRGIGFFLAGSICITIGVLFLVGVIESSFWRRGYVLIGIGLLLFIPGSYVSL